MSAVNGAAACRTALSAVLLLALLLSWALSLGWYATLQDNQTATLYLPLADVGYNNLQRAEQRVPEPVSFALWQQQPQRTIESKSMGRTALVDAVTVYGDSTLVLPTLPMLLPAGKRGCLLDNNTSYALFGDFSPVGELILLDGAEYTIAGVFPWQTAAMVLQGSADGAGCDRVTLSLSGTANKAQAAEDFAMRHQLSPYATLSSGLWAGLAGWCSGLLPLVMLACVLVGGLHTVWSRRGTPVLAALLLAGLLAVCALFWSLATLHLTVPASLIPSRWSDLDFWAAAFANLRGQAWALLLLEKELPQAIPLRGALCCAFWGMLALLLFRWVGRFAVHTRRALLWVVLGCMAAALPAVLLAQRSTASLWWLLPLYFTAKHLSGLGAAVRGLPRGLDAGLPPAGGVPPQPGRCGAGDTIV